MHRFSYHRPRNLEQVWRLQAEQPGACLLAGGTDLLVQMKSGLLRPPALISLRGVSELGGIALDGAALRVGATVPLCQVMDHPLVRERAPLLAEAIATMGSEQIRSSATLGGNLCNGSPCADSAPPLCVLEAEAELAGPGGRRRLAMGDLLTGPKQTALAAGELLMALRLPLQVQAARHAFYKQTRVAMDLALVNLAAWLRFDEAANVAEARLCAGAVGPTPLRLREVEAQLAGGKIDEATVATARALACESVQPIDDIRASAAYRRHLVGVLVGRALQALAPAGGAA